MPGAGRLESAPSYRGILKLQTASSIGEGGSRSLKRNISWPDLQHGRELTQVLEFEPSEHPDSDYDDMEERACCAVM